MCYAIRRRNAGCSCIRNYRPDGEWRWRRCWRCEQVIMAVTVRCQYWLRTSSLQQQLDDAVTVRLVRSTAAAVRSAVAWQFIAVCHHNWHSATSGSFAVLVAVCRALHCARWCVTMPTAGPLSQQLVRQQRLARPIMGGLPTDRHSVSIRCWLYSAFVDTASLSSWWRSISECNTVVVIVIYIPIWCSVTAYGQCRCSWS